MADAVFINSAFDEAFKIYDKYNEKEESLEYNTFLCCVARMLVQIYGEEIIDFYKNNKEEDFDKAILKYKYDENEYKNFKVCFLKFHTFDNKIQMKAIKKKNKYFNLVQKYLIDMFIKKTAKDKVSEDEKNDFYNLLFTANSKTFYQKSYAVAVAYNPYEIYEYAKKMKLVGDGNEKDDNNK